MVTEAPRPYCVEGRAVTLQGSHDDPDSDDIGQGCVGCGEYGFKVGKQLFGLVGGGSRDDVGVGVGAEQCGYVDPAVCFDGLWDRPSVRWRVTGLNDLHEISDR